ncbi:DNA primase, partial [Candidatus Thiomargarita nelsonii]
KTRRWEQFYRSRGRKLSESKHEPKYLNSPETPLFQKSRELYGWYFARQIRPLQKIIVVEGYMDVVALTQYGIQNAVATLGTATTPEHLTQLFRNVPEIIFCFDGDQAGQKAAWRALKTVLPLLEKARQVRFVFLPQGYDPDSLVRQEGAQDFNRHLEQASSLSDFLFDTLTRQVDMSSIDGRARLVELAKPLLKQLPAGAYRELMLQKLSQLSGVNLTTLMQGERRSKQPVVKTFRFHENMKALSLAHQAIVCLLHKPTLSQLVEYPNKKLSFLNQADIKLLLNIIEFTRMSPKLTLGAICEHWRGTKYEQTINQLATQKPHFTDTDKIDENFLGAINHLYAN